MFTSMWNFRAALGQFREALSKWKTDTSYTDSKVEDITKAQNEIFRGADVADTLSKYGITQADLDNLRKFNEEILKDIPTFRLGYQEGDLGFHVQ